MALAVEKRVVAMLLVMLGAMQVSIAAVYKVGDSAGWTTIGNVDYKAWAATKTFQVGDIIHFQYSPQFHNVMQVTHAEYRSCNTTAPISTHTTGNDSITITTRGHHYFLCGVPGHCQIGQKVDINVPRISSMAPTPSALSNSSVPSATVPAPSPSAAAPFSALKGPLAKVGFAIAVFAASASIFA
ncbi:mavicyanin-like [Cornus florida]|uniref:mavicyanin-like n=1 Tax=Cornus florida TaxID=4283 RepID=UPI0028A1D9F6|nr:mavicyanin-like [Cornus florida]